jgi:hypothetical protein
MSLLLVVLGLPAGAAYADNTAPTISGFQVLPQNLPGAYPDVLVAAHDDNEQGSGVVGVSLTYQRIDAAGRRIGGTTLNAYWGSDLGWQAQAPPTRWAGSGRYELQRADVTDVVGNATHYARDGTVTADGTGANPAAIDLSAGDFQVVNANEDVGGPVIDSMGLVTPTVTVGEPVLLLAKLRDDVSGVDSFRVSYVGPSGQRLGVVTAAGLGAAGLATGVLPLGVEGGVWKADSVIINDLAGNNLFYGTDGFMTSIPAGITPFASQPQIDLSSLDLNVIEPLPADTTGPVLHAITRTTPPTVRPGDSAAVTFDLEDPSGVRDVTFTFEDVNQHRFLLDTECITPGRVVATLPLGLDPGPLTLESVMAMDRLGHTVTYFRDGTLRQQSTGEQGTHDLDFTALDMTLDAGQGSATLTPSWGPCDPASTLTAAVPSAAPPQTIIGVDGQITTNSVPVSQGLVAVYRTDRGAPVRLDRVVRTDDAGRYHDPLKLSSPLSVRVQYLGQADSPGRLTPAHHVLWSHRLVLHGPSLVTTTTTTSTFVASLSPAAAGQQVVLQLLTSRGWLAQSQATTSINGLAVLRTRTRAGTVAYRALISGNATWATAISQILYQRRT